MSVQEISNICREIANVFHYQLRDVPTTDSRLQYALREAQTRFLIWAHIVGTLAPCDVTLDYRRRLRDPCNHDIVLVLGQVLNQLRGNLDELAGVNTHLPTSEEADPEEKREDEFEEDSEDGSREDSEDGETSNTNIPSDNINKPWGQIITSMNATIDRIFHFTAALRNSSNEGLSDDLSTC